MNQPVISRGTWLALAVLLSGAFMALLDTTIVNVAIPTIRTDLNASEATLSWIISGYALAFGLMLIPAGRAGDRYGHKWIFILGLSIFTLSSFACGRAQDSNQIVAARVVQGLGGGIFYTSITALIQLMFAPHQRGRAFAYLAAVIGFATALGPLVGGLIIEYAGTANGWRLIFDVNIPIGIVAIVAAFRLLPGGHKANQLAVDPIGLALLTGGLVALLVPLIMGQDRGWPVWAFISLAGSLGLIVLFAVWELRVTRAGGTPLVPPRLFAYWSFTGGSLLAMVYFAAFTGIFFAFALLWQVGLEQSALQSGLLVMPWAIGSIVGASQSDKLAKRYGRASLTAGVGIVAAALAVVFLILTFVEPAELNRWQFFVPFFAGGVGSGMFIAPNARFIVATVDRQDAGAASGVLGTMQRIGSAIGIAVIGSVLFGTLDVQQGPNALADAFGRSTRYAIGVSVVLTTISFLLAFAVPGAPDDAAEGDRGEIVPDVG